jgi:hypothetical protein
MDKKKSEARSSRATAHHPRKKFNSIGHNLLNNYNMKKLGNIEI